MPRKPTSKPPTKASAPVSYKLDRVDQVRLLAHPLRLRLFEAFALEPRTTHQVARALGLAPTRLYHHVNALERVGLLQLKETRQVRGATEKYYQAVARMLEVEPGLFTARGKGGRGARTAAARTRQGIEAIVGQVVDGARGDLDDALVRYADTPEELRPVAARMVVHARPERIQELRGRILALVEECSTPKPPGDKKAGATRKPSRATLTLIFTAGPEVRSDPD